MQQTMRKTRINGWYEFYRETCPICGKSGGCLLNEEGDKVACIRVESKVVFSNKFQSWLHMLKEKKAVDIANTQKVHTHEKAPASLLDVVFRAFLSNTELTADHNQHLTGASRGMSTFEIESRQYRSFPEKPWETVKKITEQLGYQQFPGIPGFYKNNFGWSIAGSKGVLIPYRNQYNEIVGFQTRVDNPRNDVEIDKGTTTHLRARVIKQPGRVQAFLDGEMVWEKDLEIGERCEVRLEDECGSVRLVKGQRYFWLSSGNKNEGAGAGDPSPVHVAVPSHELNTWTSGELLQKETVWITEGALKADIAAEHIQKAQTEGVRNDVGSTFVAIPGVNTWRTVLPVLEEMNVKHVNIAMDMDVMTNPSVEYHLKELIAELRVLGYTASLAIWNADDGKGIDDVLVNRRFPQLRKLF